MPLADVVGIFPLESLSGGEDKVALDIFLYKLTTVVGVHHLKGASCLVVHGYKFEK